MNRLVIVRSVDPYPDQLFYKSILLGILLWCRGLKMQHCHCSGLGHCCGLDSNPGLGISIYHGRSQKRKRKMCAKDVKKGLGREYKSVLQNSIPCWLRHLQLKPTLRATFVAVYAHPLRVPILPGESRWRAMSGTLLGGAFFKVWGVCFFEEFCLYLVIMNLSSTF